MKFCRKNNFKVLHYIKQNDNLIFTYLRSLLASGLSAIVDLGTRVLFYSLIFSGLPEYYRSNSSVAIGAVLGGIVNCLANYKFTFHVSNQNIKAISIKFIVVWTGNLLLNMWGTTLLLIQLLKMNFLYELGFTSDGIFTITTLLIALLVSIFWNFIMMKFFVFQPNFFDKMFSNS